MVDEPSTRFFTNEALSPVLSGRKQPGECSMTGKAQVGCVLSATECRDN